MEHIYAVASSEELVQYQSFVSAHAAKLDAYLQFLKTEFSVQEVPRTIIWTSAATATQRISNIPIPAYTNDYRIIMCSSLDSWKQIYLKQLDSVENTVSSDIRSYYTYSLTHNHILQILGHELAHHSQWFIDEAYDSGRGIWFEEGMAEYISRRYFLTEAEFNHERAINRQLAEIYEKQNGSHSLDHFSLSTYQSDYFSIFYAYWRSFLAVDQIISTHGGDVKEVLRTYQRWFTSQSPLTLAQWFSLEF